jgi:hypothetical protein
MRIRMYHATEAGAKNLPPLLPCRLCNKFHTHEDGTPMIRHMIVIVPDGSDYAKDFGPEGYYEVPTWKQDGPAES